MQPHLDLWPTCSRPAMFPPLPPSLPLPLVTAPFSILMPFRIPFGLRCRIIVYSKLFMALKSTARYQITLTALATCCSNMLCVDAVWWVATPATCCCCLHLHLRLCCDRVGASDCWAWPGGRAQPNSAVNIEKVIKGSDGRGERKRGEEVARER